MMDDVDRATTLDPPVPGAGVEGAASGGAAPPSVTVTPQEASHIALFENAPPVFITSHLHAHLHALERMLLPVERLFDDVRKGPAGKLLGVSKKGKRDG